MTTADGLSLEHIHVTVVYFVPRDTTPLPDWRDRVEYFCRRMELFHRRELDGQSQLVTAIHPEPFRSSRSTWELRLGDATFTFFQTLGEVDRELRFGAGDRAAAFPILLVVSEINWGDLEDFYRLRRTRDGSVFEGPLIDGRHFPGARSGGARATHVADRGVGWALVSADGWRVPYTGSDCVVYHEGVGHAIGLRHPAPLDGSVMSLGQYRGWLNESWLDEDQKRQLGWQPVGGVSRHDLFSVFTAVPDPLVPGPAEDVVLRMSWPPGAHVKTLRVAWQTELRGPWTERTGDTPTESFPLGRFAAPTPVSYRVRAELVDGQAVELWGYFQVRSAPPVPPQPPASPVESDGRARLDEVVDLLALIDPRRDAVSGDWSRHPAHLEAPRQHGARIEIPYKPPDDYVVTAIVTPLDEPGELIFGLRRDGRRFVISLHESVFITGRPVAIVCAVCAGSVSITYEGRTVISRDAEPSQTSLLTRWQTPHDDVLFLGADDCRYRFDAIRLVPISVS